MPSFRTTEQILKSGRVGSSFEGFFDENWMDTPFLQLPPREYWDYKRELSIEDIDLWEIIYEYGGTGIYAAWSPYAEFYMARIGFSTMRTFYGPGAQKFLKQFMKENNIPIPNHVVWVEPDDMHLYE